MELRTTGLAVRLKKKDDQNVQYRQCVVGWSDARDYAFGGQDFARSEACCKHPTPLEASYACPDSSTLKARRSIA